MCVCVICYELLTVILIANELCCVWREMIEREKEREGRKKEREGREREREGGRGAL